ncbi:hypothetical protein MtrunA17_Chr4g0023341 [Medicago truncatula]|uniref:Uncharacterized protein n=1 Tax=Medicago truncatula TaxID=3880 RepID=A0A396IBM5_MEDTR|nr:hypothetical protein MtrunA17_Chr4g0023341 [Medicago truncatula]
MIQVNDHEHHLKWTAYDRRVVRIQKEVQVCLVWIQSSILCRSVSKWLGMVLFCR